MHGKRNKKTHGTGNGGTAEPNQYLEVCKLLNATGARYLIVGGIAAFLHGYARNTKDIDIFIPRGNVRNAQLIIDALIDLPLAMAKEFTGKEIAEKIITIVGDIPRVDILTGGMRAKFDELYARRVEAIIGGIKIPVISIKDLIQIKSQSGRPRDKLDAKELAMLLKEKKKPG